MAIFSTSSAFLRWNSLLILFTGVIIILTTGCASYHMHYGETPLSLEEGALQENIAYRIFAIGDAGYIDTESRNNLGALKKRLQTAGKNSTLIFLGDNLYPRGLSSNEDEEERKRGEQILEWQVASADGYEGEIYFIAGNHDWAKGKPDGLKAVKRQEKFISDYDRKNLHFEPDDGCPGPEEIELTDDLTLVLIDSQWWLQNWEESKDINRDCDLNTRPAFLKAFGEVLKDNKEKQVIVALHHPLISYGNHGGFFTFRDHLFPLTNVNPGLYIPLPLIGSIYPVFRGNFGHVQDIAHPKYTELKHGLMASAAQYDNVIFLSGHEHNLQYITANDDHFIVSGSGSKVTPLARGKRMVYGNTARGFAELVVFKDGKVKLLFWEGDRNNGEPKLTFAQDIVPAGIHQPEVDIGNLPEDLPQVVEASISDAEPKGGLHKFFFGENYRDLYRMSLRVPVLDLANAKGGLTPVKKGGGFQTNSLRMEAENEKEYVIRSLNKDASRLLPPVFQSTFATEILQDQFTAAHPFAAFAIPGMASAAGIYYTRPKLVFVPEQKGLDRYSPDFGDALYLFEERPDGDWSDSENFGNSSKIISTGDVIEESVEKHSNRVEQRFVLRSRLFDMFIGDWDRHDDQWRWASFDAEYWKGDMYRPIPRDRDQAFSSYEGFIVGLANWYTPTLRKMSRFSGDIKRMKWFNFNARYFDRHFLNEMALGTWIVEANTLSQLLTDEVIETSLKQSWPEEVYASDGERILGILRERRDNLVSFATRYYAELAKTVDIPGTDDGDYFELEWSPGGLIRVRVYDRDKDGGPDELYYERTFIPGETKEINLYALEGKDMIHMAGGERSAIKVRVIGGPGKDAYVLSGGEFSGKLRIQDKQDNPEISPGIANRYSLITSDFDNTWDREGFAYDYGIPLIAIAANPDDGFLLGGGYQFVKHGFQKSPFASQHSFTAQVAFSSSAFKFEYGGKWTELLGPFNVKLDLLMQGPTYVQNFFGFGNETTFEDDENELDYYRVRIRKYGISPGISKSLGRYAELLLEGSFYSPKVEMTEGRFISDPASGVDSEIFDNQYFIGPQLTFKYSQKDHPSLTRRGFEFILRGGIESELDQTSVHRWAGSSLAMYYQFKYLGKPVLATRLGAEIHDGDYQFFQGAILGSGLNFRGVNKERFHGDKVFYHNTDLRFALVQWESYYLPAVLGLTVSFDYGRVWDQSEESETWHYAYGGGFWVTPFQALILSLNYHRSDVDGRFSFGMGFFF